MPRFFFPTTADGTEVADTVGSEHQTSACALQEGHAHVREMAMERLRQGDLNFKQTVEIRAEDGTVIGRRAIAVSCADS